MRRICLIAAACALGWGGMDPTGDIRSKGYVSGGGVVSGDLNLDENDLKNVDEIKETTPTSDVAAGTLWIEGGQPYAQASVNTSGGNIYLIPGSGTLQITIDDASNCAGDYVRWYFNDVPSAGTLQTFEEGVDWTAVPGDNAATAASLASAVNGTTGMSASSVGAVVYVQADLGSYIWTASEQDATCTTIAQGAGGSVLLPSAGAFGFGDGGEFVRGDNLNRSVVIGVDAGSVFSAGYSQTLFYNTSFGKASSTLFTMPSNGTIDITNNAKTAGFCLDATTDGTLSIEARGCSSAGNLELAGTFQVLSSGASMGWAAASAANTACTTTCAGTGAAVIGFDQGTNNFVGPSDATADTCLCAGPSS